MPHIWRAADGQLFATCPRCGRENVKLGAEERMVSHLVPSDPIGEGPIARAVALLIINGILSRRPRCPASDRRPENALIAGSLLGREDLRLGGEGPPPLGPKPGFACSGWRERARELAAAIDRRVDAGHAVPGDWTSELHHLLDAEGDA